MSEHAKGPWKTHPVDDTSVIDATGAEVACVGGDYNQPETWPIMEANARLIARAPEMADTITRLTAENERLRAALEPFANAANRYDPVEKDDEVTAWDWAPTIGMLRIARAALTQETQ